MTVMTFATELGSIWLPQIYIEWLFRGAWLTAVLAVSVCVTATLIGLFLTSMLRSRWRVLRLASQIILSVHRNTPLMVQLLLWYFGIASLLSDNVMEWLNLPHSLRLFDHVYLEWPSFEVAAAFIALTLYSASFISGELDAGLRGVDNEQKTAAYALGMTSWQVFYWIVLPQAFAFVRRPLLGQYATVVKDTSLTMAIGVAELSYRARQVESETLLAFQAFAVATLLYLTMILLLQYKGRSKNISWKLPR